ncbi:MAG: hypothetical protein VX438_05525, partial [Planctomycetota bacterium]|nr:hypothetical protein [Planctomycetota bacterium]
SKIFVMAEDYQAIMWINEFITICAIGMGVVQIIFVVNFFASLWYGKKADRNPWHANTLEWAAPSPPGHGNFDFQPIVSRGPYEYSHPDATRDYLMQTDPPLPTAGARKSETQPPGTKDKNPVNPIQNESNHD